MKIAQLALNSYDNYGNLLQKYALHKTLKKFASSTEVLWYSGNNRFWVESGELPPHSEFNPNDTTKFYLYESVRMAKIKEFEERYVKVRFDLPYIEEIADEYDFFVMGSDQVWNPFCGELARMTPSIRFLDFVPREKKIAYAASIALKELPEKYIETWQRGISTFPHISVREANSVGLIKNLTGLDAELVIDPVLLLTPEEWLQVAQRPSWLNEKYERGYILTYLFDNIRLPEVQRLSKELNLPIINLLDIKNFNHYITGESEFLYLFAHATAIFTNSFHGTAFSILFKRPFVIYVAKNSWSDQTFERMNSITKMFNLQDRVTTSTTNYKVKSPLEIDFSVRDKILPYERAKAFKFLTNALSENNLNKGGALTYENRRYDFKKSRRLFRLRSLHKCLPPKLYIYAPRRRRFCVSENQSRSLYKLRQVRKSLPRVEFQACNARQVA